MKTRLIAIAVILLTLPVYAQRREEKPKVHADFQFGSLPTSKAGEELLADEKARWIIVGYHEGWMIDRIARNFKVPEADLIKLSDKLEDARLAGRLQDDYGFRPGIPVIREKDYDRVKDALKRHTSEFSRLLQSKWPEIEAMVTSLDGTKTMPKDRVMYETVVSGILFGGMIDALWEDKTLLPPPSRRGYFGWLIESNPAAAGKLKREIRESDGYRVASIGTELPAEKLNASDLRGKATVLEDVDARKYRTFISVFCRDQLLPFFKSRRQEFLAQGAPMSASNYIAFAGIFGWYYDSMANGVVDDLVAARKIAPPEKYYTYAVRAPQQ